MHDLSVYVGDQKIPNNIYHACKIDMCANAFVCNNSVHVNVLHVIQVVCLENVDIKITSAIITNTSFNYSV